MSDATLICPSCGARPKNSAGARFCEFCGAELPTRSAPVAVAPAFENPTVRFERLRAHAGLGELLAKRPSSAGPIAANAMSFVFACIFLVIALIVAGGFWAVGNVASGAISSVGTGSSVGQGVVSVFKFLPLLFVGIGAFLVYRMIARGARFAAADLAARPALVVDERIRVTGGGDAGQHTAYFVAIEDENGQRTEFETSDTVAGKVTKGDMGVAYVRADRLLDFERVAV